MSEDQSDDKQFDATEQKLRKAREKGDFPRSTEVNAALAYLGALAGGALALGWAVPEWLSRARQMWAEIGRHGVIDIAAPQGAGEPIRR